MKAMTLIKGTVIGVMLALAGCGSDKRDSTSGIDDPVSRLSHDMVLIPGKNYFVCKFEVTQSLWEAVMGENPSWFKGADRPVENVSWNDCQKFLGKLNALPEVKEAGVTYRLPTADEWEYACRAGATGDYCKLANGTEITRGTLGEVAWYEYNSGFEAHPVGKKKPNAFGLYDMHGNVDELTSTIAGVYRITCGGSTFNQICETGVRCRVNPDDRFSFIGFRLAGTTEAQRKAAEAEREVAAEAERKAMAEASKGAVAKLAADMVPIPGKNYSICKYEATQALWFAVMGETPSKFKGAYRPIVNVSWDDCQMFLEKLNAMPEAKESGFTYRLPTADEWEYACRAGATGNYCRLVNGIEITKETLGEVAWFESGEDSGAKTNFYGLYDMHGLVSWHRNLEDPPVPVGQKKPNALGLYDMLGNVWECTSVGLGVVNEAVCVLCGGCLVAPADFCMASTLRVTPNEASRDIAFGFRLAGVTEAQRKAAEAEREAVEEVERKAIAEASKGAVARLVADMVPIPGKSYSVCKYEVTQALWLAVMGENPSKFKGAYRPVENVSWNDCQEFLGKLNDLPEVRESGFTYRLPTAEEWEYACRAGATGDCWQTRLADGSETTFQTIGEVAWFYDNSNSRINDRFQTHPVGQKKPNAFGFYDMHGNVWEWTGTTDGGCWVCCGGSWLTPLPDWPIDPAYRDYSLGFRLASTTETQRKAAEAVREAADEVERKMVAEASKGAVAKLAADMVPIPGKNYSICKYEVTQALWFAVMGENPAEFKGACRPVENVSWDDCQKFLEKLNVMPEVKEAGVTYRLPTADEWEYACRAGAPGDNPLRFKLADGTVGTAFSSLLDEVAWHSGNSWLADRRQTHPVGQKKPNAFGLYDMFGNVMEWTPTADGSRVCRGSSCWGYYDNAITLNPDFRRYSLGFRLAR